MIKKLLLVAVVGVVAFAALRGTKFFGLAKDQVEEASTWLDSQIPVEKEISRLRKEVAALDKDRVKVGDMLAKEIVEVRYLRESTEESRVALEKEHTWIQAKAKEIKDAPEKVKYSYSVVPVNEAKAMLAADVTRYMNKKSTLDSQEKALAMREQNKEYLGKQLDVLKRQKESLAVEIDALEADYKALQLAQMESKFQTDSTRLAKIKESLRDVRKKLEVERVKLDLNPRLHEEAPAAGTTGSVSASRSVDEIMAPVNGTTAVSKK